MHAANTTSRILRRHELRPILGFGPVGWVGLAVAIALGLAWAVRPDLFFLVLAGMNAIFGIDAVYWFVTRVMASHTLNFGSPMINPANMCFIAVWLHVMPWRVGVWRSCVLWITAIVAPTLVLMLWPVLSAWAWSGPLANVTTYHLICVGTLAVFAALMLSLCRSWAIAGGIALSAAAIPLSEINTPFMNMLSFTFSGDLGWYPYSVVYITGIGIIPLIWAIRERGRVFPDTACQSCGYDLRGLEAAACPECGAAVDHD